VATNVKQVNKGIELLDRKGPENWWNKINLEHLHMEYGTRCVLGQTFGDYEDGLTAMFGHASDLTGVRYGFYEGESKDVPSYRELQAAWEEEIRFRQLVSSVGLDAALTEMPQMSATEEEAEKYGAVLEQEVSV